MENVEAYLKEQTGYDWQELSPTYLKFKLQHPPFGRMCVFTPDDIRKARARLYQPDVMHSLHNPNEFVEKYLNAKKTLVKSMPWVKIDLDQFPELKRKAYYPSQFGQILVEYSLGLTGDIKLRNVKSNNNSTIGLNNLNNIAYNTKLKVWDFIQTFKVNFDFIGESVSVGSSLVTDIGTTSLKLTDDGEIEADFTPKQNVRHLFFQKWEIEGQLGYRIKGRYQRVDGPPPTLASETVTLNEALKIAGIVIGVAAIVALIIFTDGAALAFI